ncbi:hypothetical protein MUK42_34191 [Musa troglodytarum]|uniref:Uncharacterized protein n=1 Tax=Musa troglodytarum TaxID=320322 RepID=A0A9E7E7R9_9LILI|nr:hypothetical protein MUK42_34191 [Musa troglodytarum]
MPFLASPIVPCVPFLVLLVRRRSEPELLSSGFLALSWKVGFLFLSFPFPVGDQGFGGRCDLGAFDGGRRRTPGSISITPFSPRRFVI